MSDQQNIEAVRATYDAFNRGDLEGALNSVSDDYQITITALGGTMEGKDGFLQYL